MMRQGAFRVFLAVLFLSWHRKSYSVRAQDNIQDISQSAQFEGCNECGAYRCPANLNSCLLGSVPDPCECCKTGICAKIGGELCWNSSIKELPPKRRNHGFCAPTYECQLRTDLEPEQDEPEAVCVCKDQTTVCGSNNQTYTTSCELTEEAMRINDASLRVQYTGPCPSRPWIASAPDDVFSVVGQRIALNCEVKGFPVPEIFWEFHSTNDHRVIRLPSEDLDAVVNTRDGPENYMRTSWVLLSRLEKVHVGKYYCIANNTVGESSTSSIISLL